ncbi:P-loop containing nucleoside triphosphate hydrolase protein [Rhizophagus irregularis]|uniref:P-loop containing nucleoside triphosphate hydrolase protein n=1 Tax=Rhizophagus irregularis TaxID=588596 RepID=A0A2I1H8J3_9GLOM|nr:P-loop containing nucleoside triphosphate hydrolase protein [Rhizophagus irregularis]
MNFPMSCDAGLRDDVLSFQYVILPLLGLLTRTAITDCNLEKYVHAIFTAVYTNLEQFLYNNVMKMLEMLLGRNSVVDRVVNAEALLARERYAFIPSSLGIFFLIIVRLLTELLRRIKEASVNETMHKIFHDLQRLKTTYQQTINQQRLFFSSTDPLIDDLETREYFFTILEKEMKTMNKMLNNGRTNLIFEQNPDPKDLTRLYYKELARKVDAKRIYDPPGELSKEGQRHDNDFVEIDKISIIPTREEILCERKPFLPSTLPDSLHFLPYGVSRLLDTQFRLLREDMLNPIRGGIYNFLNALLKDWSSPNNNSKLSAELKKIQERGGRFKYNNGISDNGDLQVYTHVQFVRISCNKKKGFYCTVRFNSPRFRNSGSQRGRKEFWEKTKKLLTGSLIAILLPNPDSKQTRPNNAFNNNYVSISKSDLYSIYFGVVALRDENTLSDHADYCDIDISFIDPSIYPIALNEISRFEGINRNSLEKRFMVETTGVYFESYYHILKTLKETDPNVMPFDKYLAPNLDDFNNNGDENVEEGWRRDINNLTGSSSKSIIDVMVGNPLYTVAPGFQFDLSVLFKNEQSVKLSVAETISHNEVVKVIEEKSKVGKSSSGGTYGLDDTQAKALIYALTREIALIEGPPGTGKTVVGIQIMKVLLAKENRKTGIGPILTICFTNHALDQFLEHLLDEGITKIVRLGSRSKSDRVRELSLDNKFYRSSSDASHQLARSLRAIEEEVKDMTDTIFKRHLKWDDIKAHLKVNERRFFNKFNYVTYNELPNWVLGNGSQKSVDGFEVVGKKKKKKLPTFERWVRGEDIAVINKRKLDFIELRNNIKKINAKGSYHNTFEVLGDNGGDEESSNDDLLVDYVDYDTIYWVDKYEEPKTDRPIEELLKIYSIWKMSRVERIRLHDHWRAIIYKRVEKRLSGLQKTYDVNRKELDDINDEERREILLKSDVIGMTTNGAAKFQELIRSVDPKVIVCEEAGEVLEAHILSALTPSTQHLILIGDHNQLRPNVATFTLSMDSQIGKNYQLDQSLFERLVKGDNAVKIEKARLLTQRRMRKEVSDLIRNTLYSNLVDGDNTARYENIRGAQQNVYFIDHRHPEDGSGGDFAIQSHANKYEVKMVVEMVKYFVRNGYTKQDDIAVLTPYLGQMMKIREALAKSFVVVVDERDEENITQLEEDRDGEENDDKNNKNIIDESVSVASTKSLNQQVTLRTVDNFQGEEATIIIVSLVRNFSGAGGHDTIGFLKSTNRSNVLLSRAREGMYLIGNSELMASRSKDMWEPVIKMLRERDPPQVGFGMPIVCNRHPNYKHIITEPEQFDQVSPDGGCKEQCDMLLPCGHACTQKCHSDDPKHVGVQCFKRCTRLQSGCNHPCPKLCYEDCGRCEFSVGDIVLLCDHEFKNARCWQEKNKEKIKCKHLIDITLPCDHILKDAECWREENKESIRCTHHIDIILPNCGHILRDECCKEQTKETLKCEFPMGDIILDCGHIKRNVECWQNQMGLICTEVVTVKLPSCGHNKVMNCNASFDNVKCKEKCGKQLACDHECLNECHECQELSSQISGVFHGKCKVLCNKLLFCGHLCRQYCHKGECSPCKNRCSISCEHTRCNRNCLDPCALCAEKCSWECRHQGRCELSCGIPCSRLPCNERCGKALKCGHKCAGVCGEVCPSKIDFCVVCAPEKVKNQVSDTISDIIFSEIDWNQERMIVLSCGHVFTMKSMDALMEMKNYYEGSNEGGWISLKELPTPSTDIKTCPECNSPIKNIKRYGRVIKKHTLDTQNKKFLLKYHFQLEGIRKQINSVFEKLGKSRRQLKKDLIEILESESIQKGEVTFKECKNRGLPEITPYYYFENIEVYHGFDENTEQVWIDHVRKLLKRYDELTFIIRATKFPPHKKALEASITNLNANNADLEEQLITQLSDLHIGGSSSNSNSNSNSTPPEYLQFTSQVDRKIYLDAVFEMINVQKILYGEILFIIHTFESEFNMREEIWITFAQRLQQTIQQHLYAIREAAELANYGRYFLLVNVEILELDLKMIAYQLRYQQNDTLIDNATQKRTKKKCEGIKERTVEVCKNYRANDNNEIEGRAFKSDIYKRLEILWENCDKVINCVENSSTSVDSFLGTEELSEMKKIDQITRLKLNKSGHWYECSKGHPYIIEEFNEATGCPDCNMFVIN